MRRVVGEFLTADRSHGEAEVDTLLLGHLDDVQGLGHELILVEGVADVTALGLDEGVAHSAADDQVVNLVKQVLDDAELRADLRTADDSGEGVLGVLQHVVDGLHLFLHEVAEHLAVLVEVVSDDGGRGVLTVSGAEGVVHIDVGIAGELLGEVLLHGPARGPS